MKALTLALAVALIACADSTGPDSQLRALSLHEQRWRESNIRNYDFDFTFASAWIRPLTARISVRGGVVASSEILNLPPGASPLVSYHWPTLDSLFALAGRELTKSVPADERYQLSLAFDPRYAFVSTLNADIPKAADDEYWMSVANFVRR